MEKKKKKSTTKKSNKTAKAKKDGLKELSQTHGKVDNEKPAPTTLDQLWGDEGLSKYGTMNEEEYSKQIDEYNRTDLQTHAGKLGIVPLDDRGRLTKTLIAHFRKHVANYNRPADKKYARGMASEMAAKIMSEGR
jgi:hypothetical protein